MSHEIKYIGMDVHKEAIVIAVLNESGKLMMESVIETKASSILQFLHGLRGELHVTWEEGTWAAWLYDLLQPQVQHIVVCNPRRNALLKEGSKSDKVDARKLADLLRTGMLRPVYHGMAAILRAKVRRALAKGMKPEMVVCAGVPVFSLCEHHLLPFKCEISMAYIASEHVLGLSKFARIAHKYSHRLQVQERLVHQIADEITAITDARDVAVLARGEHLCMQMRGIKSDGLMSTSVMRGLFRSTDAREEFLTLALGKKNGKW